MIPRGRSTRARRSWTALRPTGSWRWAIIFRSQGSATSSNTTRHIAGKPSTGLGSERIALWRNAMPSKPERFRIAVLDDYQNVALSLADWSALDERATVTVFNDHLADPAKGGNPALDTFEIDRDS